MTDALNAKRLQGLHTTQDPAAPGVSTADVLDDVHWGVLHDALVFDKRQRKKRRAPGAAGVDADGHPDEAGAIAGDADAAAMETDSAAGAAHDGSATTVDGDGVEGVSGAAVMMRAATGTGAVEGPPSSAGRWAGPRWTARGRRAPSSSE